MKPCTANFPCHLQGDPESVNNDLLYDNIVDSQFIEAVQAVLAEHLGRNGDLCRLEMIAQIRADYARLAALEDAVRRIENLLSK